jgi:hypothetical protein
MSDHRKTRLCPSTKMWFLRVLCGYPGRHETVPGEPQYPAWLGMEQPALLRHVGSTAANFTPPLALAGRAHGARTNEHQVCARQRVVSWLERVRRFGRGATCRSEKPWSTAAPFR